MSVLGFDKVQVRKDSASQSWQVFGVRDDGPSQVLLSLSWRHIFDTREFKELHYFKDILEALSVCDSFAPLSEEEEKALRMNFPSLPESKVKLRKKAFSVAKKPKSAPEEKRILGRIRKVTLD